MSPPATFSIPLILAAAVGLNCTGREPARTDAAAAAPAVVTLTATDFAFDAPDTIPAGFTTFRLENNSDQFHMAQLVRFERGRTLQDFLEAYGEAYRTAGPRPEWTTRLGGPGGAEPHGGSNATHRLEPGSYAWICLMNPPPDRLPHVLKGMAKPFVVRAADGAPASGAEPEASVVIRLVDYDFILSTPLTAGRRMIRVQNRGAEPHEVALLRLAPGKTMEDLSDRLRPTPRHTSRPTSQLETTSSSVSSQGRTGGRTPSTGC